MERRGGVKMRGMYVLKMRRKKGKESSRKKISPLILNIDEFLSLKIDDGRIWIMGGGEVIELTETIDVEEEEEDEREEGDKKK